ncbi:hypothetical protein PybrP1_010189 [[Pythium] brassicae (nom. inval.)]|nr:hypothetical protein PybrP1_010189 [[Pythium] brassicae (nom. inval.)]
MRGVGLVRALAVTLLVLGTSAADQPADSLVDAKGIVFTSQSAFCRFHCSRTHARRARRELRGASECTRSRCPELFRSAAPERRALQAEAGVVRDDLDADKRGHSTAYTFANVNNRDSSVSASEGSSREGNGAAHAPREEEEAAADDKDVQVVNLVTCQNVTDTTSESGARVALAVDSGGSSAFRGFYDAFFRAYDAMLASADAAADACQLQFLQQGFLGNRTSSDKQSTSDPAAVRPMLCVGAIKDVWGVPDTTFTPFLTRSDQANANATVMLVHVNTSVADALVDLGCVAAVTALPAILKLTPFARSSFAYALEPASATEGPALEVRLVLGSDYSAAFTRLATAVERATGIANAVAALGDTPSRVLAVSALEEFETWAKIVALVVDDAAVEWVDLKQSISTGALKPDGASLEQRLMRGSDRAPRLNAPHRRLDPFIQDLMGVKEMQRHNITGAGIVVGVTDTGLYVDHDQFDQPSRAMYNKVDSSARKVVLYRSFANKGDESEQIVCGHGTHVSGLLAGNSYSKTAANLGIAYDAQIAFMDIGKQALSCVGLKGCEVSLETPGDVEDLMSMQVQAGAKIFSFSWGTGGNDYNTQSRDLDNYIYSHPETLIIVAAGNSGDKGAHSISSPSGAKNVLSIGASLNDAASFATTSCPAVLNKQTVASFSSIGPTLDGRQKPDLVAPGMTVLSAQSEAPGSTTKSTAICSLQGTSQATPVVAGMAVLLYEWLRDGWWKHGVKDAAFGMNKVPAALLKALLIHSGEKLARRLVAPKNGITSCVAMEAQALPLSSYPDFHQGYGKPTTLNLANFAGANSSGDAGVYFYPNSSAGSEPRVVEGGEARFSFLLKPRANLRVTLVWTDPAGSLGSKIALQNDLDLSVRVPNTDVVFFPLSGNGSRDAVNNVEMVEVTYEKIAAAATAAGVAVAGGAGVTVEVVVSGYSVKAGAKSGQAFALVASSSPSAVAAKAAADGANAFWQPWMTIGLIVAGTLAALFLIAVLWRVRSARAALSVKKAPARGPPPQYQHPPVAAHRGGHNAARSAAHGNYRADAGDNRAGGARRPSQPVPRAQPQHSDNRAAGSKRSR